MWCIEEGIPVNVAKLEKAAPNTGACISFSPHPKQTFPHLAALESGIETDLFGSIITKQSIIL